MKNNFFNDLKQRLSILYLPLSVLTTIILILVSLFMYFTGHNEAISSFFSLFADIVTVVTLIFLIVQILFFCKDYDKKHARKSKENALDLSKFYAHSILPKQAFLCAVLFKTNVSDELKKIQRHNLVSFDQGEYHTILDDDEIKKFTDILDNIDFSIINKYFYMIEGKYGIPNNTPDEIRKLMTRVLDDTLNDLEYMSMAFTQKVADETVVYQSLHQTFIKCVEVLYFRIVHRNFSSTDKYYTNVITLYHSWKKRATDKRRAENASIENHIEYGVPLN